MRAIFAPLWILNAADIWRHAAVLLLITCRLGVSFCDGDRSTSTSSTVKVRTESGVLEGKVERVVNKDVYTFFGVPFAKPPLGELRFRPPEMVENWQGVKQAFTLATACIQNKDTEFEGFWGSEMWNANTPMSEDCLYMNIWAPKDARNATVMVWLYGGGFYYGSASLAIYDALGLSAVGDVIVINVNYRMGAFGFLFLDDEEIPGNIGMLDQQMALKWIKRNAAAFGGDPAKVCLFGESAGAASIVAHMVAPSSATLFKNGILQSGSLDNPWSMNTPRRALAKSMQLVEKVGCAAENRGNIRQIAKCLRKLDAEILKNELWSIKTGFLEFPLVMVSKDKAGFFVNDAFEALRNGNFRHTDIMIGINADEGVFWLVYYLKKYVSLKSTSLIDEAKFVDSVEQAFGQLTGNQKRAVKFEYWDKQCSRGTTFYREAVNQMVGDYFFTCDSIWLGDEIVRRSKGSVYIYHFEQRSSNNPWPVWMGVMHGYEIEYVFGLPVVAPANFTGAFEHNFSRDVIGYWKSFAETSKPQLPYKSDHWPEYNLKDKPTFILKAGPYQHSLLHSFKSSECEMWRQIRDEEYDHFYRTELKANGALSMRHASPVIQILVFLFVSTMFVIQKPITSFYF